MIRFPVTLLNDRCFAWLALAFLYDGCSFAISVAVILTYRHSGPNRASFDTDADLFRAGGYCCAYACRCDYCQYALHHDPLLVKPAPTS
jgi:hypothetical protein